MLKGKLIVPEGYGSPLGTRRTEAAILRIKEFFQQRLSENLDLYRVSAPPFVVAGRGINDDLSGTERKVAFDLGEDGSRMEIVQSLAKWKRMALARYGFGHGEGIWTDMNAIRRDEIRDNIHSIYVDQWDWEKVILPAERDGSVLKGAVERIYDAIKKTERMVGIEMGIAPSLPEWISFMDSEELRSSYPSIGPKEREHEICRELGAVFLMRIGWPLEDGAPHDLRAPDYDDWNLNGDILVWNPVLQTSLELSSMGIRVDKEALLVQLSASGQQDRLGLEFHRMLMEEALPQTMGGGIGQSRLCMLLLGKAHIGEVQVGQWPSWMVDELREKGIELL